MRIADRTKHHIRSTGKSASEKSLKALRVTEENEEARNRALTILYKTLIIIAWWWRYDTCLPNTSNTLSFTPCCFVTFLKTLTDPSARCHEKIDYASKERTAGNFIISESSPPNKFLSLTLCFSISSSTVTFKSYWNGFVTSASPCWLMLPLHTTHNVSHRAMLHNHKSWEVINRARPYGNKVMCVDGRSTSKCLIEVKYKCKHWKRTGGYGATKRWGKQRTSHASPRRFSN